MAKSLNDTNAQSIPNSPLKKNSFFQKITSISTFRLILISQLIVLFPHIDHLPTWLTVYGYLVVMIQLYLGKSLSSLSKKIVRVIQLVGFFGGVFGLYLTYKTAFGLDIGVSFLLLCLISKLLELFDRRDGYIVLNLSLFVLAGAFLMSQGLITTLQVVLGVSAIFFAMIAHNDVFVDSFHKKPEIALKKPTEKTVPTGEGRIRSLFILTGLAVPLMVVLFIFFPRIPPLWSINLSGQGAKTGMSDSMSPGDIANLSQSTELAFRVLFEEGQTPEKQNMYWRGMVFSEFDGITWKPSDITQNNRKINIDSGNYWLDQALYLPSAENPNNKVFSFFETPNILYSIIMEPTNRNWLFALDVSFSPNKSVVLTREFNLEKPDGVTQQFTYKVRQLTQAKIDVELDPVIKSDTLNLPENTNPKTVALANKMFKQANENPEKYVNTVLQWIREANFSYTLSPPPLFDNRIDQFLFKTKSGFCEHYSSAFTFMMRAVGIPARVVVGYQGGEKGSDGKSWEVRQMDAHAWTEVWLAGKGWTRVDPTAAIAPTRINNGMNQLTQSQGAALFGSGAAAQISYQQFKLLQKIRKNMDYLSYVWQRDVVGFDQEDQENSMLKWFNLKNQYQQILLMFTLIFVFIFVFVSWQIYQRRKKWHPVDKPLVVLSKQLTKTNLNRHEHEGVLQWLNRIGDVTNQSAQTNNIASVYRQLRYAKADATYQLDDLTQAIKEFNRTLES